MLLLSGNWLSGAAHAALLLYMLQLHSGGRMTVDTTDAFRQLPQQKKQRGVMLGVHLALFVLVVYRCARGDGGGGRRGGGLPDTGWRVSQCVLRGWRAGVSACAAQLVR
jgi:hypothetical protein